MPTLIGAVLAVGFIFFSVDAFVARDWISGGVFTAGLIATLYELLRQRCG